MPGVGLIENLKPFQPGHKSPRRSADVDRAIRGLRRLSPKAVEYCQRVLEDDAEETVHRVRVALAIIDKVWPSPGSTTLAALADAGIAMLRVEFHAPEHAHRSNGHDIIDVRLEPPE